MKMGVIILRNLKISRKLLFGFMAQLFLSVVIGVVAIVGVLMLNHQSTITMFDDVVHPMEFASKAAASINGARTQYRSVVIYSFYNNKEKAESAKAKFEDHLKDYVNAMENFSKEDSPPNLADIFEKMVDVYKNDYVKEFLPTAYETIEVAIADINVHANSAKIEKLMSDNSPVSQKLYDITTEAMNRYAEEAVAVDEKGTEMGNFVMLLLIIVFIVAVVFTLVIAFYISRIITNPIRAILSDAGEISAGNLNINNSYRSKDEVGQLSDAFGQIAATLNGLMDGMSKMAKDHDLGEIETKVDGSQFRGAYKDVAEGVNKMVFSHVDSLLLIINILNSIAKGQFEISVPQYPGKKAVLNQAIESIKNALTSVSAEVNSLTTAASNGALSKRVDAAKYEGDWATITGGLNNQPHGRCFRAGRGSWQGHAADVAR